MPLSVVIPQPNQHQSWLSRTDIATTLIEDETIQAAGGAATPRLVSALEGEHA